MPSWLNDAVFYEIYPQSFYDSNEDGIGDIQGIIQKLDYVKSLGCNAIWINPCFESPFKDAGYDVSNYEKVAPRYGTNDDLIHLFQEAHARGMHIMLDLVPGHTSEEHEWFKQSQKAEKNQYSNRFIWTNNCFQRANGFPFIGGESERTGTYILNFFKCQPALNYGFYEVKENWQLPMTHPDCIATREAMKDVMRFWLDKGCDGFRVDMANSLIKNDDSKKTGTCMLWQNVREMLDKDYPEAAIISEWCNPELAIKAGFHMDFYLSRNNGYSSLMRDYEGKFEGEVISGDASYFKKDGRDPIRFLDDYLSKYKNTKDKGLFCFITGNHDTLRSTLNLSVAELKLAYAFLLTMPGAPFIYYGDEIGMRYIKLPTKEGGYHRTGSRTPMQWSKDKNLGFSSANADQLYLPVDPSKDAPTVTDQESNSYSLLNTIKSVLALRHANKDLQAEGNFEVVSAGTRLLAYRRGKFIIAVNPGEAQVSFTIAQNAKLIFEIGKCNVSSGIFYLDSQSFGIAELSK